MTIDKLAVLLSSARRDFTLAVDRHGTDKARQSKHYRRMAAAEREMCRAIREAVPAPDISTPCGPMPARPNRAAWVEGVLWVLVEQDPDQGFLAGAYPVAASSIVEVPTLA